MQLNTQAILCLLLTSSIGHCLCGDGPIINPSPLKPNPKVETAFRLANGILDEIFETRHKELYDRIKTLTESDIQIGKDNAINHFTEQQKTQNKNGKAELEKKKIKIRGIATETVQNVLIQELDHQKTTDTIAILMSDDGVSVAGNIKTRKLDADFLSDPALWTAMAKMKHQNSLIGLMKLGTSEYSDIGFRDADFLAIDKVIKENIGEVDIKVITSAVAKPESGSSKIQDIGDVSVDRLAQDVSKVQVDDKLRRIQDGAKFHAEIQLLRQLQQSGIEGGSESVIVPSKPPCQLCKETLDRNKGIVEYGEDAKLYGDKKALGKESITNWEGTDKFIIESVDLNNELLEKSKRAVEAKHTGDNEDYLPGSCSKNSRRKRGIGGGGGVGCIYIFNSDDSEISKSKPSQNPDLNEIRSKEFISEYVKTASQNGRREMTQIADNNLEKMSGSDNDIAKVSKVVEYEKMQKHRSKVQYLFDGLNNAAVLLDKSGKTDGYDNIDLVENTKLSPSKTSITLSKGISKFVKNAGKVSNTLGKFLLAKSIVTGIAKGDTTSLAIIGGRVGGELLLGGLSKFGAPLVTKLGPKLGIKAFAKGASKGLKFLGKAAGPLGSLVDIGLSGWSLSKSISRLNNPNSTRFEQNEAIADIVQESVDIAITVAVTVASIAFPPLAPLFAVIGFFTNLFVIAAVLLYKAHNHVNSLDAQVKLLDFEKDLEVRRYVIGQDTSVYIQNLVRTKFANNLVLNATIDFLETNGNYIGRVYPSRSFKLQGGCRLIRQRCSFSGLGLLCWKWQDENTVANNCYEGGKCLDSDETCEDKSKIHISKFHYDRQECKCDQSKETVWGYEHANSLIDFRSKSNVYVERAAPDSPSNDKYSFICLPSSLQDQGYQISQRETEWAYLCQNAMGVKRVSGRGQFMLYEMGGGNDTVQLALYDRTDNQHLVEDGHKLYYGSAGADTFLLSGPCSTLSGTLDGRGVGKDNTIAVMKECAPSQGIKFNLTGHNAEGRMTTGDNGLSMVLKYIQVVYGRGSEPEEVVVGCSTKVISAGGGKSLKERDVVKVERLECSHNVTIVVDKYTELYLTDASGNISLLIPTQKQGIRIDYYMSSDSNKVGQTVFFFQSQSQDITGNQFTITTNSRYNLVLKFKENVEIDLKISVGYKMPLMIFEEEGSPNSNLIIDEKHTPKLIHFLQLEQNSTSTKYRTGAQGISNYFELVSGNWVVNGGKEDDDFVISKSEFYGELVAGGGQNTIYFDSHLPPDLVTVDEQTITGSDPTRIIRFNNVQRIIGRVNKTEILFCTCGIRYFSGNGGQSEEKSDKVVVRKGPNICDELTILSSGFTEVVSVEGRNRIVVVSPNEKNAVLKAKIEIKTESVNANNIFVFQYPPSTLNLVQVSEFKINHSFKLRLGTDRNQIFKLSVTSKSNITGKSEHWSDPKILFEFEDETPSSLVINRYTGVPLVLHQLFRLGDRLESNVKARIGTKMVANYFQIFGGAWNITGGDLDDDFDVCSNFSGEILGGRGINRIHICNDLMAKSVEVNLSMGLLKISNPGTNTMGKAQLSNIQSVLGRASLPEDIHTNCATNLVSGNGGSHAQPDIIHVQDSRSCSHNLSIIASGYTTLISTATAGNVQIYIQDDVKGHLGFKTFYLEKPSIKGLFVLKFQPKDILDCESSRQNVMGKYVYVSNLLLTRRRRAAFELTIPELLTNSTSSPNPYLSAPDFIFATDSSSSQTDARMLIDAETGKPSILHILRRSDSDTGFRFGAVGLQNIFNLNNGQWVTYGGKKHDTYFLQTDLFLGSIVGGEGINSLVLSDSLISQNIVVHLQIGSLIGLPGQISLRNIQVVKGSRGKTDTVICDCHTKYVSMEGGSGSEHPDIIRIPNDLNCLSQIQMNLTIAVESYTKVENLGRTGTFIYIIKDEYFTIKIENPEETDNFYQFQYGFDLIDCVHYDSTERSLRLRKMSDNNIFIPIRMRKDLSNPGISFVSEDGSGNVLKSEIRVDSLTEMVRCSIFINYQFDQVRGLNGANNEFYINSGKHSNITGVQGGSLDNVFWLGSVNFMNYLIGGNGTSNSLILLADFYPNQSISIDMTSAILKSIEGNKTVISELKNIRQFKGRSSGFDTITIDCDTIGVSGFESIWVRDTNCVNYKVTFDIGTDTSVIYDPTDELNVFNNNSSFYYNFDSPRSFDIGLNDWFDIRDSEHVFYLPFSTSDLEEIFFFSDESTLFYVLSGTGTIYNHSVDPYLEFTQEFYAQPSFLTNDGFQIRISRNSEIIMSIGNNNKTSAESVQTKMIPKYSKAAATVSATLLIQTENDFLYISASEPNVLTNVQGRSHLCGLGSSTVYVVLSLDSDVYIYHGWEPESDFEIPEQDTEQPKVQTVDLTEIIWTIRNETQTKYIPKVRQVSATDFEIMMEGFEHIYPGKICLVNAVQYFSNFQLLLHSVVMRLEELSSGDGGVIDKRSLTPSRWALIPNPISVTVGSVNLLDPEDFEVGQEIIYGNVDDDSTPLHSLSVESNFSNFEMLRNDSQVILTNLATSQHIDQVVTVVLLDAAIDTADKESKHHNTSIKKFRNFSIRLGNVTFHFANGTHLTDMVESGSLRDWEDIIEESEILLLDGVPEITRQFQLSGWRRLWKQHRILTIVLLLLIAFAFIVLTCVVCFCTCFSWKRKVVINKTNDGLTKGNKATTVEWYELVGDRE